MYAQLAAKNKFRSDFDSNYGSVFAIFVGALRFCDLAFLAILGVILITILRAILGAMLRIRL
jgi:hypothetical protein